MRRREFISLFGGAVASSVSWPLAARAQQPAMQVVGFLSGASLASYTDRVHAFRRGLREAGYGEGRNVAMEFRWAEGESDRLPALAADLVSRSVSLIAAGGNVAVRAAKGATSTIPIVFTTSSDPVQLGFVASLSRPGGNLTGVTSLNVEVGPKRLELMRELVPTVRTMALLVNPTNPNTEVIARELQASARIFGLELHVLRASSEREIEEALSTLSELRVGGLLIGSDLFFNIRSEQIAKLAFGQAVPAIFQYREFTAAGGLMSYGGSSTDLYRQAGVHAGKILRGEKPADLPVQQSTKVELIINLRTAKALGLSVPLTLLGRADEVIE